MEGSSQYFFLEGGGEDYLLHRYHVNLRQKILLIQFFQICNTDEKIF